MSSHSEQSDPEIRIETPGGTRRTFFTTVTKVISGIIGLSLAVPLVGYFISPALKRQEKTWRSVGKVSELPVGEPKSLNYTVMTTDGWMKTETVKAVWALRQSEDQVTVYSPICPHLGCGFRWEESEKKFKCPCHGSVYDLSGKVLAGPAPRPLDELPSKVENGELLVIYKQFKSGLTQKVEI